MLKVLDNRICNSMILLMFFQYIFDCNCYYFLIKDHLLLVFRVEQKTSRNTFLTVKCIYKYFLFYVLSFLYCFCLFLFLLCFFHSFVSFNVLRIGLAKYIIYLLLLGKQNPMPDCIKD